MVRGYKALNCDFTNRYGLKMKTGVTYRVSGPVVFGNNGNGYHFCKNLEDTLRFVDGTEEEIKIVEVIGSGQIVVKDDDYNSYYDMMCASELRLERIIEREEIINYYLNGNVGDFRIIRFIMGYKLFPFEVEMFMRRYFDNEVIINALEYYQNNNLDVYERGKIKVKSGGLNE